MKHIKLFLFLILVMLVQNMYADNNAKEIMIKVDTVNSIQDMKMEMEMILTDKRNKKIKKKFIRIEKNDETTKSLMRFTYPSNIKGTSFLTIENINRDDDMWIYFASMRVVKRIAVSGSDRSDKFMGSDFTYGDMDRNVEAYNYTFLRDETLEGVECYVIEAIPINENVKNNDKYSKKIEWVRKDNYIVIRTDYYNLNDKLQKTYTVKEIQKVGEDKFIAKAIEMYDHIDEHGTYILLIDVMINNGYSDNIFNKRNLEKKNWDF